jgi:hypothetical protein
VWIDGVEHGGVLAAALALRASSKTIRAALEAGRKTVHGSVVSAGPWKPKPAARPKPVEIPSAKKPAASMELPAAPLPRPVRRPRPGPRAALLRYPPGEGPLRTRRWR